MIQNNGLTLDLLLGLSKADSVVGQVAATEMRPFSELLTGLMSPGTVDPAAGAQPLFASVLNGLGLTDSAIREVLVNSPAAPRQSILAEMFNTATLETARPEVSIASDGSVNRHNQALSPSESQPSMLTIPVVDLMNAFTGAAALDFAEPKSLEDLAQSPESPKADETAQNLQQFMALTNAASSRMQHQSTGLADGTYRILAAAADGDRLQLTLKSADVSAEPIQVSLPLSVLNDLTAVAANYSDTGAQVLPARVALNHANAAGSPVADLLAKLNLKELRVDTGDRQSSDTLTDTSKSRPTDTLMFTFRGGQAQPFTLGIPVNRRTVLTQVRSAGTENNTTETDLATSDTTGRSVSPRQVMAEAISARAAQPTDWPGAFTPLAGRSAVTDDQSDLRPFDMTGAARLQTDNADLAERLLPGQVRFTLPDQIARQLKPNGRSVSIAIEPEHLGKATLRLSISNQMLTARLTVDTPAAKAMVEQSLDQLTQQLLRAGIKVDLISVTVAGGDAHTNLFGRRQQSLFDRPSQLRRALDHSFATNLISPVPQSRPSLSSYVGPSGVNVYA
jgi:flagellar hook-length control protein FliK